jgi:hypothetical protein
MKPKHLANVLIKLLGLSEIVRCLPQLTAVLFQMLEAGFRVPGGPFTSFWASTLITLVIGIVLIVKSRAIAELLFHFEYEESPEI